MDGIEQEVHLHAAYCGYCIVILQRWCADRDGTISSKRSGCFEESPGMPDVFEMRCKTLPQPSSPGVSRCLSRLPGKFAAGAPVKSHEHNPNVARAKNF